MAGTVQHAKLETRTARARLARGRQPHWQAVIPGRAHLGYQRREEKAEGRWLLRRYVDGKYTTQALGRADDAAEADGQRIHSLEQVLAAARAMLDVSPGAQPRITLRSAYERYYEFKRAQGQPTDDLASRARVHILPTLGHIAVADLTAERLRRWLANMAAAPAQYRPKGGKPQYRPEPVTEEDVRRRRATANRVLTILKAMLNFAHHEGHVSTRDAWSKKLRPFEEVTKARVRYLTVVQAKKLIRAADPQFAPLLRAALETGCRYGELTRLQVDDFDTKAGTVAIRRSKSGKPRKVVLTSEGAKFFRQHCTRRAGGELMFTTVRGKAWEKSYQFIPMLEACARAGINPPISFHGLRHTWASHAVMGGVPLFVVAKNLGHSTTRQVEQTYAHLTSGYVTDAIRKGAPRFG